MATKRKIKKNPFFNFTIKKERFSFTKQNKILLGSVLILFSIALAISFTSFFFTWKQDQSVLTEFTHREASANNLLNKFGAYISSIFIYKGVGIAAFIFPVLFFYQGAYWFLAMDTKKMRMRWFWGITYTLWFCLFFSFILPKKTLLAGVMGYELFDFLQDFIGKTGVFLVLFFGLIFYLVVKLKITPDTVITYAKKSIADIKTGVTKQKEKHATTAKQQADTVVEKQQSTNTTDLAISTIDTEKSAFELSLENLNPTIENPSVLEKKADAQKQTLAIEDLAIELVDSVEEKEEKKNLAEKLVEDFGEFDPTLELSNYTYPTLELLQAHGAGKGIVINKEELEENKNNIVETLKNYKIEVSHIKATIGPTVTLYEIVPAAGVRISKIKNLEDDIALSLAALGIRIIAPIPGKGTIGIEVPNKNPSIVAMKTVVAAEKFQNAKMELPIALGKTISNETFVVDLAKMPHLLMAGATGQGKSVGLNAILTSLLYKKHPAEVKFVLVDPKKVELTLFNKIERHFLAKLPDTEEAIITDNTKVINTLNSLCIEMDNRYDLLKNAMVRNLKEYNTKFKARKLNPNDGHRFLPYIVLVVDEFADLIMTAGKEVELPIARLAQLARAVGIHLIIATQRPSVNVITGMIKANFPARIAFRVTSKIDSRTILDSGGADQLIGRGDMLYTQGNDLVRIQCAFVDTPEVDKLTEFIGSQKAYASAYELPEYIGEDSGTAIDIDISERDVLFEDAAQVIVNAQQGSASLLQRKLKLGYNRAGRLIDQLEAAGIVGPFEGSKARQVLIPDLMALEEFLNQEKK